MQEFREQSPDGTSGNVPEGIPKNPQKESRGEIPRETPGKTKEWIPETNTGDIAEEISGKKCRKKSINNLNNYNFIKKKYEILK